METQVLYFLSIIYEHIKLKLKVLYLGERKLQGKSEHIVQQRYI